MPRSKSHAFSIYLLKDGVTASNALIIGHGLKHVTNASEIPQGASLYVGDRSPTPPWWRSYFGISDPLLQSLKSALLFVPLDKRWFALSFGHAYTKLDDTAYEYDFGLRVTLNSIDPEKLNSVDTVDPSVGRRRRTQVPNDSDLTLFDIDKDSSIFKKISGKVKDEHKALFKHPSGASSLKLSSQVLANDLPSLLNSLFEIYLLDTYNESFPNHLNITPVNDPTLILSLNKNLIGAMSDKDENVYLSIPELVDFDKIGHMRFLPRKKTDVFEDAFLGRYYDYLEETGVALSDLSIDKLKSDKLSLIGTDEKTEIDNFSIYRCMVFDTSIGGDDSVYHLNDGNWYNIDKDYKARIESYLDSRCRITSLPPYNHSNEGEYNEFVPKQSSNIYCLDEKFIKPTGESKFEACDLFTVINGEAAFIHVKRSTRQWTH